MSSSDTLQTLGEQYESACRLAAQMYADGADTTTIDAECDRIEDLIHAEREG